MTLFEIGATLLGLSSVFGFINHYWFKLPHTIGLVLMALAASGMIILADLLMPQFGISKTVVDQLNAIDFSATLMEGMLSVLLFAGAVHVDLDEMAETGHDQVNEGADQNQPVIRERQLMA